MEVFLELTRDCNMACTHCLRGDALNQSMSQNVAYFALRHFEPSYLGIGGGEPLSNSKDMQFLRNSLLQASVYPDDMWIVTNGIVLAKEDQFSDDPDERVLTDILLDMPIAHISLAVSTDKFHGPKATHRYNLIQDIFSYSDKVSVTSHGTDTNLVDMGRYKGGLEIDITCVDYVYVDINGYIWAACDLSYEFMDNSDNRNSIVCFGNVLTNTLEQIRSRMKELQEFLNEDYLGVTHSFDSEEYRSKLIEIEIGQEV